MTNSPSGTRAHLLVTGSLRDLLVSVLFVIRFLSIERVDRARRTQQISLVHRFPHFYDSHTWAEDRASGGNRPERRPRA